MSNKYRLEGEAKSISLGGIGRVLINLILIVAAIFIFMQIENWNKGKQEVLRRRMDLNEMLESAQSDLQSLKELQATNSSQIGLFSLLMETANRQVGTDTLSMAVKHLLKNDNFLPSFQRSLGVSSSNLNQIIQETNHQLTQLRTELEIQQRLLEDKLETFLIRKQVLSLVEPYLDLSEVAISDQQVDRIIRVLLNDREFIDLIYLRISRLQNVIDTSDELETSFSSLISMLEMELIKTED